MTEKQKKNIEKAASILRFNKLKKLELCNFGIYYQYEVAGTKISVRVLEDCDEPRLSDDDIETLANLLSFITDKFIYNKLKFPDEGQNTLYLKDNGTFGYKKFSI